jgi:alpha-glucosidase (family GH31 glycosyl hydrolase)
MNGIREGIGPPDIKELNNPLVEPACRQSLKLRYRLLPYTYTLARRAFDSGEPLMQPLWLRFPDNPILTAVEDQFFWGSQVMVAPVLEPGVTTRKVILPEGLWYDFWTGKTVQGDGIVDMPVDFESIPMFVPAGSILPLQTVRQFTSQTDSEPLEIRIYPGKDGTFSFYDDDGESLDYQTDDDVEWIHFSWTDRTRILDVAVDVGAGRTPSTKLLRIILVGSDFEKQLKLTGESARVQFP